MTTLVLALSASAAHAGGLDLSWTAPTASADGNALNDLAGYRVYVGAAMVTCPGGAFASVTSPSSAPAAGTTVSTHVSGLVTGTSYAARVTAVDSGGNESPCSAVATGSARTEFAVTPSDTTDFGTIAVGSTADRTFVVQNVSQGTVSGSAAAVSPFSLVSGAAFSLAPGASQNVAVRFRPAAAGAVVANVTFAVGGDSVGRVVSGTGAATTATLTVTRTGSGTVTSSPSGLACGSTCSAPFALGTTVTLTAAAATGLSFTGWTGACAGAAGCTVTLAASATVGATFTANNPVPAVTSLAPSTLVAGGAAFTLSVNGTGFVAGSTVRWNGATRATTFVSATQLQAAIGGADVATAGTVQVSVTTPAPGGGTSSTLAFTITPPPLVPTLGSLAPASTVAGSPAFTLTVNGTNFVTGAVVRWNGAARPTTFVSATQLQAAIPAADVATAASVPVSVANPLPGGASAAMTFTVTAAPVTLILDNAAVGVQDTAGGRTFTGTWCRSTSPNQYGPDALYSCGSGLDTYRWTPNVPAAGAWDVYVWITTNPGGSTASSFAVVHAAGTTTRTFDQRNGPGGWVLHGRYTFAAGRVGYVQLSDVNGPAGADAVRFVSVP